MNTSVLFLTFNRLDTTKRVFAEIQKAKPPRLYIASDGARKEVDNEQDKVQAVRNYLLDNIDWKCEVKTLFREENLGCKYAVSGAIDWFFENVEMGIILEDDCLPDQSFFPFCEVLLEKYKEVKNIGMISGRNSLGKIQESAFSYSYNTGGEIWGWATWRDRYKEYKISPKLNISDFFKILFFTKDYFETIHLFLQLQKVQKNQISTWDYQWSHLLKRKKKVSVTPTINLIRNIGFSHEATHTTTGQEHEEAIEWSEINFPLVHPLLTKANIPQSKKIAQQFISKMSVVKSIVRFMLYGK